MIFSIMILSYGRLEMTTSKALGTQIVNALLVTNDNAERGVALVQELNKLITHEEEQFQFLLQVVADHRRQFSSCQKSLLHGQSSASNMN